ncbi:alpha/beta hydrolase [Rhodococcus sp. SRB_17]|nr:alpha/beta hydrolase [Rhodococcus sp. SRB_17]
MSRSERPETDGPPRRRLTWLLGALLGVVLLVVGAAGWILDQNSYEIREETVTITGGPQPLQGVLALPQTGAGPYGLVVFVHGDGSIDATHETFYRPIWESLARAGYASLSWDKPGVNGAPGNWLDQSMDDRAAEALAAIAWSRSRPEIDPHRIGLWGASQAGWVLPKVAAQDPSLQFMIAVSPAVNWLQQGRYNTLAESRAAGASAAEVEAALSRSEATLNQLRTGATFEEFAAAGGDTDGLTADRWRFIAENYTSDASADLVAVRIPVLLIVAGHDQNVDVVDTEATYRALLREPGQLSVEHYPDATHSLVRKDIEDSDVKTVVVATVAPRSLFADGFLTDQRHFVEALQTRP